MRKFITFLLVLFAENTFSQNTLHYNDEKGSQRATLNEVKWLYGSWKNNDNGTQAEENWSMAGGKTMHFSFKLWNEKEVVFYEIGHIIEKNNSLLLQIKHFDKNLKGWETQEETQDFKLIKIEKNRIYFDSITYERVSDTELTVYVFDEESKNELVFKLKK